MLSAAGILAFALGSVGIYLAMPSIAPGIVDSTRVRLDSLGLLSAAMENHLLVDLDSSLFSQAPQDSAGGVIDSAAAPIGLDHPDSLVTASSNLPAPDVNEVLTDSLRRTTQLLQGLQGENAVLAAEIERLENRLDDVVSQQVDAAEIGKSLGKLEDKQLGSILAELDLNIVELLYLQVSQREQSRLLQNMPPERAARFVKMLVSGPISASEVAARQQVRADGNPGPSN